MDRHVYDRMRELEQSHWWFTARREILASEIGRLPLPAAPRILEVGCATGGNLGMLARFGQVQAIEPDEESRLHAAQRTGLDVRQGFLPDRLPDFGAPFDLIAAFDVIEHVDDDAGAVAALAGLLGPRGLMITTVPAHPWMWSPHDEAHHHKRRYRRGPYRALFERAGLKIRRTSYFNTALFPPIAAVRFAKKLAGREGGDEDAMPSGPVNGLLHRIFAAEKTLLKGVDLPFGVSILLIAETAQ